MKKPFRFIEGKVAEQKSEFMLTEGVQPTYALLYLREGSFRLKMEGKETILNKGDFAIFSDDINFFRSAITPISFIIVKFQPNPACPFAVPIPLGKVEFENKSRFDDSMKKYIELMEAEEPQTIYYKEHLLEDILLQASAEKQRDKLFSKRQAADLTHDKTVILAVQFIRKNLKNKLSVEEISHAARTNGSTLNFKFRKELSCSVGEFITEERMKKACRLLANTTYTIGEIAIRCGFENIYYFSTAFRKYQGKSPTEFRKQYR